MGINYRLYAIERVSISTTIVLFININYRNNKSDNKRYLRKNDIYIDPDAVQVETFGGEAVQLVKLRNPLGPGGEYVGAWARGGLEWDEVPVMERDRLAVRNMAEGEFW